MKKITNSRFKTFYLILFFTGVFIFSNAQDTKFWGMTAYGGSGTGVIFNTDLDGNGYSVKHTLNSSTGASPYASLFMASDGLFYGTTYNGGSGAKGVVFKYDTTSNSYTKIHDFTGANGYNPSCTFIEAPNGKLYGTTWQGGTSNLGVLFEVDITQTPPVVTKKIDFTGTKGSYLQSGLMITSDDRIFGVTQTGGSNNLGVIYEYDYVNNSITVHHDFDNPGGRQPFGSMMEASDGKLYAIARASGANGYGTIFRFDPSDNSYENVHDFNGNDGNQATGDLIEASDGMLYGLSWGGGIGNGTIYQFNPVTDTAILVHSFNNTNGKNPYGTMAESSNGKLYGMTSYGGTNGAGVLFEFDISDFSLAKKHDFEWGATGGFPFYTRLTTGSSGNGGCTSDTTNIAATTCDPTQAGITQQLFTNASGCDSLVITTTTLLPGDTTNVAATTCDPGQVGVTLQLFSNQFGCDSLVITTTTLLPSDTTNVAATTCDPGQVGVTLQLFSNQFGCDSLVITTTTLLPGDTTNVATTTCDPAQVGITQQLFTNMFGCDSLVITSTTLLPSDTTYISDTTCDPSQVGVTQQLLTNMFGCDSLVITTTSLEVTVPEIVVISSPITLWPPNHKYASFDLDNFVLSVSDNCTNPSVNDVMIVSATSDEPENGSGDGNTFNDIVIGDDCQTIKLRKERKGNGNGRVYTIHFELDDGNGNIATASAQVHVPKNNGGTATDDGPVYEVESDCGDKSALLTNNSGDVFELINYPNPFRNSTTISFSINNSGTANLKVYNSHGKEVALLFNGMAENGHTYDAEFKAQNLPKGIYVFCLQVDGKIIATRKMIHH